MSRAAVFVVWPAAWRYGVCSSGKSVIGNGGGVGADSTGTAADPVATPLEDVFAPGKLWW